MTVRGLRNNNPLNIRKGAKWQGLVIPGTDKEFCQFRSMAYGLRAAVLLIRNHCAGYSSSRIKFDTIGKLIRAWAPACENDTQTYIKFVCTQMGVTPDTQVRPYDRSFMVQLVSAMAKFETGSDLSPSEVRSAYDML